MYSIKLHDGTVLQNLELNGNNYISSTIINDSVFDGNLATVVITNNETGETETCIDMMLMSNRINNGRSWFVLSEKSQQYKEKEYMYHKLKMYEEQLAQADETSIALYESQESQEIINTQQDEALMEIYEMLG